jgi:hypothetical protein
MDIKCMAASATARLVLQATGAYDKRRKPMSRNAERIYTLYFAKFTEGWYQLAEAEQQQQLDHLQQLQEILGIKPLVTCDAHRGNEQWEVWGVEECPSLTTARQYISQLEAMEWFRYLDRMTFFSFTWPTDQSLGWVLGWPAGSPAFAASEV